MDRSMIAGRFSTEGNSEISITVPAIPFTSSENALTVTVAGDSDSRASVLAGAAYQSDDGVGAFMVSLGFYGVPEDANNLRPRMNFDLILFRDRALCSFGTSSRMAGESEFSTWLTAGVGYTF